MVGFSRYFQQLVWGYLCIKMLFSNVLLLTTLIRLGKYGTYIRRVDCISNKESTKARRDLHCTTLCCTLTYTKLCWCTLLAYMGWSKRTQSKIRKDFFFNHNLSKLWSKSNEPITSTIKHTWSEHTNFATSFLPFFFKQKTILPSPF